MQTGPMTDPRDEGFGEMLRVNVSPNLHCFSFAVVLSILLTIIFAVQVGVDGLVKAQLEKDFLPADPAGPFGKHLVLGYDQIRTKFEFWRFLSALFVHRTALHLLSSIVSLLIWASLFERLISPFKIQLYFFLGGVLAYLFANLVLGRGLPLLGTGPGIFAIFGGSLGYLIYNWKNMEGLPSRFSWVVMVIFIIVFSLLFSGGTENLATHTGGFLAGLCVGFAFSDKYLPAGTIDVGRTGHESAFFVIGVSLLGLLLILPLTIVFLTK